MQRRAQTRGRPTRSGRAYRGGRRRRRWGLTTGAGARSAEVGGADLEMNVQTPHPSAGWFDGRTHFLPVRVYYEDTDFTGVVYHANYVRYFERGRSDFLRLAGIGHRELLERDDPAAFVITRMALDYRKPAKIDDALLIATTYDQFRGAALQISQRCLRGADVLAVAQVAAACVTLAGRPRRPPPDLVAILRPFLSPAP